jgi:nitroimidazol reductase NimA-like FMN-containing flavoprotein (pyridoxamine 5'-phosphate oxidase superfamily)
MDQSHQRTKCRKFLRNHDVGVIASATLDGRPHASVVNYYANDKFEIYFIAREHAQKFKNILVNPLAALVVTDDQLTTSLEIKGDAFKLDDTPAVLDTLRDLAAIVRRNHSGPLPIMNQPGSELHLFCLQPRTIAYADFRPSHPNGGEYFELELAPS